MSLYDVLVVGDEPKESAHLQAILMGEGLKVQCVSGAQEALATLRQEKPQLIVLDLIKPEMSGDQLCSIIKKDPALKNVIVFILSGKTDVESKLAGFESGAEEFLVKPIEPRELTARVGRFIKLVDDLKVPGQSGGNGQTGDAQKSDRTHSEIEIPSLALEDFSFVKFQSTYGNYRVESMVGKGGMGQVYKAKDEQLDRDVAIKVLSPKLMSTPQFVERFRREAKVLASINHTGIASIYAFSEQKGEYYFAMQWCPGGSLTDLIRKKGSVETLTGIDIMLQCAWALSAAQKKGVVHRDIKPSNLMFDEEQMIKVVDFGLAFAESISSNLTQGGEFLGTPSYMSPEQAKSPSVDHRADIYSLGITFYHMLYGKLPFKAASPIDMVIMHTSHPFPAFDDKDGTISRATYNIIEKMTQKDPANRYQDYATLILDLEHARNELLHQSSFKVPVASRIAPVATLTSANCFELLAAILASTQTGVLTCRWSALEKRFLIQNQEIVFFDSLQPDESIWIYLFRKGILKKEELPANRYDVEQPLNRFLLNNTFTMEAFRKSYRELMTSALDQIFMWPVFDGLFATADIENEPFCAVPIADYLLNAARTVLDVQQVKRLVPAGAALRPTPQFNQVLLNLHLNPEESFIASRIEGESTTAETLGLLTGLPEETILRAICALQNLGAVQYKNASTKPAAIDSWEPRPAAHPPRPPAPPVIPRPGPVVTARPAMTTAPAGNGAPPAAAPHSYSAARPSGLRRDPVITPTPAGSASSWPDTPAQHPHQTMARMGVQKSDTMSHIEHDRNTAEQLYKLAKRKYVEGNFYEVTSYCKQAIANNPDDARYHMLMAKAYAHHPRFSKDAESSFHKGISLDEANPNFYFELAQFYAGQGLLLRAINECKRALSINPTHEKSQQLLEDLRARHK